jgi:uncharacterized protein (TIGR02145 family)
MLTTTLVFGQTSIRIHKTDGSVVTIPLNQVDSITYIITNPGTLATVTTTEVSNITTSTAIGGGNITNEGGSSVLQRGVCWSTNPNPTTANSKTTDGSGAGSFTSLMTGLQPSTNYFYRAYAINNAGVSYGEQRQFTTASSGLFTPGGGVTDIDGNRYNTIILGNQEWMRENLKTTRFRNGEPIPLVLNNTEWVNLGTSGYGYYDNISSNINIYGILYNWYVVSDPRNVCPTGWHVPSDGEWNVLTQYLGGENIAGGRMKSTGTIQESNGLWASPNTGANNESGFSGLPAGIRTFSGTYSNLGTRALWWSSTEDITIGSVHRYIFNNSPILFRDRESKRAGLSIRCVKD